MPLVSVSFHQSCPKFWWYAFYRQHKPPSSPEQRIFPLVSSLQQFDKSFVSRHFCYGVSDVNSFLRQYRLNSPTLLWDYSHIVPLNQIEVTSETWSSIVYNLVVSGAIGVIHKIFTTLSIWLTVFSPRTGTFSLGSLSTNWKYPHSQNASWNNFRGPSLQVLPHPSRVSLTRACSLFHPLLPRACYKGYFNLCRQSTIKIWKSYHHSYIR